MMLVKVKHVKSFYITSTFDENDKAKFLAKKKISVGGVQSDRVFSKI